MAKFYALLRAALAPPTIFFIFVYSFPVVVFFRSHTVFIPQKFLYTASSTSKLGTSVIFCRFWLILKIFDEIWPFFQSCVPETAEYECVLVQLIDIQRFEKDSFMPYKQNSEKQPKLSF